MFALDASPVVAVDKPRLRIINSIFRKNEEMKKKKKKKKKISNVVAELDEGVTVKRRMSSIDRFKKEVEEEHRMRVA